MSTRTVDVTDRTFGADPTGIKDSLPALKAAVASFSRNDRNLIVIPPGNYLLSDTWVIDMPVRVMGGGQVYSHGTTLLVRSGRDGIRVVSKGAVPGGGSSSIFENFKIAPKSGPAVWTKNTPDFRANESVVVPSKDRGGYAGLAFLCVKSGNSGGTEPDFQHKIEGDIFDDHVGDAKACKWKALYIAGVKLLASSELRNVFSSGFPGDGFSVVASSGDGNNANSWLMHACKAGGNSGWGFFTKAADSNAGMAIDCISQGNGIGGYQDSSFLGNSYVACEADGNGENGNGGYSYLVPTSAPSNGSTFIGCYVEAGQKTRINGRAMWFGGLTDPAFQNRVYGSGNVITNLRCNTLFFQNDSKDDGTGDSAYCRVGLTGTQTVLEFGYSQDDHRRLEIGYGNVNGVGRDGWVGTLYDGTLSHFAMSLRNASEGPGHFWIPNDLYLGELGVRNVFKTVSGGPPTSGAFKNGDFAREASPHLNGMFGFQFLNGRWVPLQPKSTRDSNGGPINVSDYYYGIKSPGLAVALPAAATFRDGHEFVIKDETGLADVSPHTVTPNGADKIDGSNAPWSISKKFGSIRLIRRDGQWWTIA